MHALRDEWLCDGCHKAVFLSFCHATSVAFFLLTTFAWIAVALLFVDLWFD